METSAKQFRKRNAILNCLLHTTAHPSAEMVHEMLQSEHPDISLATIYRNLSWFKDQGMIVSLGTVNGIERFDANMDPHVHFICSGCGAVTDLHQIQVPQELNAQVEETSGCSVRSCQLTFSGLCGKCRNLS